MQEHCDDYKMGAEFTNTADNPDLFQKTATVTKRVSCTIPKVNVSPENQMCSCQSIS
jgi:hypothetical protein